MTIRNASGRLDDANLHERMKAMAHERKPFGYRRLHVLLRREGHVLNHKWLLRFCRQAKHHGRRHSSRKRALGTRSPMLLPMAPHERRLSILCVVNDCTRDYLALVIYTSLSGGRVARELDQIIAQGSKPKMIVSDNGTEFTGNADFGDTDRKNERKRE